MSAESLGYILFFILLVGAIRFFYLRWKTASRTVIVAEAYFRQGLAKAQRGDFRDAIIDFDAAIKLHPSLPNAKEARDVAVKCLDTLSRLNNSFTLQQQDDEPRPDSLDEFLQRLGRSSGDDALDYLGQGGAKHLSGENEAALADLNAAIELRPNYVEAYGIRGTVKCSLGHYNDAIEDFDSAIRMISDDPDKNAMRAANYFFRAEAKYKLGQYAGAIADYDATLRLNPANAEAYLRRGVMKSFLKDRKLDAFKDLQNAMELADANHNTELQEKILAIKNALEQSKE